jgi:hypothetical protein
MGCPHSVMANRSAFGIADYGLITLARGSSWPGRWFISVSRVPSWSGLYFVITSRGSTRPLTRHCEPKAKQSMPRSARCSPHKLHKLR